MSPLLVNRNHSRRLIREAGRPVFVSDARHAAARRAAQAARDAHSACPGLDGVISTSQCAGAGCSYCGQGL
jgi:RNase P protein component